MFLEGTIRSRLMKRHLQAHHSNATNNTYILSCIFQYKLFISLYILQIVKNNDVFPTSNEVLNKK